MFWPKNICTSILCTCVLQQLLLFHIPFQEHTKALHIGRLNLVRHSVSVCSLTITFIPHSLSRAHKSLTHRQIKLGQTFCVHECSLTILFHIPFQEHTKDLHMGRLNLVRHSVSVCSPTITFIPHSLSRAHVRHSVSVCSLTITFIPHSLSRAHMEPYTWADWTWSDILCPWVFSDNYFYSMFPFKSTQRTYTWADCTWSDASAGWSPAPGCPRWWTSAPLSKRMLCLRRDMIHFGTIPF